MTIAVIHHINSNRLDPYPGRVTDIAKNKIAQKEASLLNVVSGSLKDDEKLQAVNALHQIYNSDAFLQKYNDILCKGINDAFNAQFKDIDAAAAAMFGTGKGYANYRLTDAFRGVKNTSYNETAYKKFNTLINNLRNGFSSLFPQSSFSGNNRDFFTELAAVFKKDALDRGKEKTSLTELVANLETLSKQYNALVGEDGTAKKGKIPEKWLSNTYKSLYKVIGAGLWEQVTMRAKAEVLKDGNILEEIKKTFQSSGLDVTKVEIGEATQTGATTANGKSVLADSMIEIRIYSGNEVKAVISTGDSTKFSQSLATRGLYTESAGTKNVGITDLLLSQVLSELGNPVKLYWEKRMSPFLTANDTKLNASVENWNDTLQAIKMIAAFDAIAVRIGGGAQTLSFNTKIMSMRTIAELAANNKVNGVGASVVSLTGLSDITKGSNGNTYASYINAQYNNLPSEGNLDDEPERHQDKYNQYIKSIMDTKFHATVNLLAASRRL